MAATAYRALEPLRDHVRRVVLLGPSHRVPFRGLAVPTVDAFETPLGLVALDTDAIESVVELPQVVRSDHPHAAEHSLEVHLPFLQEVLGDFQLVPVVVGDASAAEVAEVIEDLCKDEHTFVVVSSDLSHFLDYETARELDRQTSSAIEALRYEELGHQHACGRTPIAGLLEVARRRGWSARTIDLRSSGDTVGGRDRVVGYGSYAIA